MLSRPLLPRIRSRPLLKPRGTLQVVRPLAALAMARIPTPPVAASDADEWQFVVARGATPAHYVYAKPLQKSEQDDREYRVVRLLNGLQAVLVHDAKTDKAAASLDVAVGHLSDPVRPFVCWRRGAC